MYRGLLGYGAKGHEHHATFLHPTGDLPIMISVIDFPEKIAKAAEAIEEMLEDGLIVVSMLTSSGWSAAGKLWRRPMQPSTPAKLLRMHISESDRVGRRPLYEAMGH